MNESAQWHDLIPIDEIEKDDVTEAYIGQRRIAIYDTVDGMFASDAKCSHAGANLCHGYFDGKNIECPLHQGLFDARSGNAKAAPATRALKMFELRTTNGIVQIKISPSKVR